jgi:hypothetical protein
MCPPTVKNSKLKKGEVISQHSNGIMMMKWKDKKDVSMVSTFHDATMRATVQHWGAEIKKPACILEYNKAMSGVDLKYQKLQPYLLERKKGSKWYIKLFRQLLNVSVHNALTVYNSENYTCNHLTFRLQLITALFERYGQGVQSHQVGRPSINPPPQRLTEWHFIEKIPATGRKAKPQKRCVVCQKKRQKEGICVLVSRLLGRILFGILLQDVPHKGELLSFVNCLW